MKSIHWFVLMQIIAFLLLPIISNKPKIEEYRPSELQVGMEKEGIISIFDDLVKLTALLILLKVAGFKLRWIIDFAVFMSGYLFGDLFEVGIETGLILLAFRKSGNIKLYNLSSFFTILFFSLILSRFITPEAAMLFMALLSLYDVIGVLYFPYIKFLWLQFAQINFDGVALVSDDGFVGAGDYALPLIFTLSFGFPGILSLPLLALGFFLTSRLSRIFGAFPGLPTQAFFAYLFYLAFS